MVRHTTGKGLRVKLVLMSFLVALAVAGPALAPTSAAAEGRFGDEVNCGKSASHRTLQEGNTGKSVRHLQCLLNFWGYNLAVDGDFGPRTDAAVADFQSDHNLVVDGIVGERAWEALHPDSEDTLPGKPRP